MSDHPQPAGLLPLTAEVVVAYVSNNSVPAAHLAALIGSIHDSFAALGKDAEHKDATVVPKPAVSIKKSVTPDFLISLEDGKKYKSLRRHLAARYGLTPDEYRAKWGLPADYPMVAPNYKAARSEFARKIGLGRPKAKPAAKTRRRTKVK